MIRQKIGARKKNGTQLQREIDAALARSKVPSSQPTKRHHATKREAGADDWDVAMDAILENDAKRAAKIVHKIHEDHGAASETPEFSRALGATSDKVRKKFRELTEDVTSTTRYRLINYDVWGNENDGFEINNQFYTNDYVEIPKDASDAEIVSILKDEGIIKKSARKESIEIEGEEGYSLRFTHRPTGRPEFELRTERD